MAGVWAESKQSRIDVAIKNIVALGDRILKTLGLAPASLSIVITDSEGIRRLNREYLGRDRPTNVISFPMKEGPPVVGDPSYLGDIVLSIDAALEEAEALGYQVDEMIMLYMIHGVLHLCGYNHEDVDKETAMRMETKQRQVFNELLPYLKTLPIVSGRVQS